MDRRTFLTNSVNGTLVTGLGLTVTQYARAQASQTNKHIPVDCALPGSVQSERGVAIHPNESKVMKGSPPPEEMLVTSQNLRDPKTLAWQYQHHRELFPTQRIWRGKGPISTFARPQDADQVRELFDGIVIQNKKGQQSTIRDYFRAVKIDGFLAMKVAPAGKAVILNEQYFNGMRPESVHGIFSGVKPMHAMLLGLAMENGLVDENGKVQDYIPELRETAYHDVTIRHVLDMVSGVKSSFGVIVKDGKLVPDPDTKEQELIALALEPSTDPSVPKGVYGFLKVLKRKHPPGTVYNYSNPDADVVNWVSEKVFNQRFSDLFSEKIYQRLGPEEDAQMGCDWRGSTTGMFSISLRDFARIGEMILHKGQFRGKKIIDRKFFDQIDQADPKKLENSLLIVAGNLPEGTAHRNFIFKMPGQGHVYGISGAFGQFMYIDLTRQHIIAQVTSLGTADSAAVSEISQALPQISLAMDKFDLR